MEMKGKWRKRWRRQRERMRLNDADNFARSPISDTEEVVVVKMVEEWEDEERDNETL